MAQISIGWDDGTGDELTITYTGTSGVSTLTVSSDPNLLEYERQITLTLETVTSGVIKYLTVKQQFEGFRDFLTTVDSANDFPVDSLENAIEINSSGATGNLYNGLNDYDGVKSHW